MTTRSRAAGRRDNGECQQLIERDPSIRPAVARDPPQINRAASQHDAFGLRWHGAFLVLVPVSNSVELKLIFLYSPWFNRMKRLSNVCADVLSYIHVHHSYLISSANKVSLLFQYSFIGYADCYTLIKDLSKYYRSRTSLISNLLPVIDSRCRATCEEQHLSLCFHLSSIYRHWSKRTFRWWCEYIGLLIII